VVFGERIWRRQRPGDETCNVTTTSLLHSILNWLRAGYPEGVPGPDRVPLLALLRATPLTEDQIKEVVRDITGVHVVTGVTPCPCRHRSDSVSMSSPE
jgi:hypothetical protein